MREKGSAPQTPSPVFGRGSGEGSCKRINRKPQRRTPAAPIPPPRPLGSRRLAAGNHVGFPSASDAGRRRRSGASRTGRIAGRAGGRRLTQRLSALAAGSVAGGFFCGLRHRFSLPASRRDGRRSPRRRAAPPFPPAAGRRRWCRSRPGAARRRPRAPGSHSRPPCRAIRRWRDRPAISPRDRRLKRTRVSTRRVARSPARRRQREPGVDAMRAPREQAQAILGFVEDFAFGQDASADADHGVGGQDQRRAEVGPLERDRRDAIAAFSALRRCASARGDSLRRGVSSMSAGMTASGSTPICASSARRRGEPEASTRRGRVEVSLTRGASRRSVHRRGAYLKR